MDFFRRLFGKQPHHEAKPSPDEPPLSPAVREVLAELARSSVTTNNQASLERALAARPDLQAKLAAALGSGPVVPLQFQVDLEQAQRAEQRYMQLGDRHSLDEAVAAWERILQHPTFSRADNRFQLATLNDSGVVFLRRYWAQGQLADLNRALQLWQTAVQQAPSDSPELPTYLNNLGNGLSDRYDRTGQLADLEEAICAWQAAVERTPLDSPELPRNLNNLGHGLSYRYNLTGQWADLEEAIHAWRTAVQHAPPDSPELPGFPNNLGNGLRNRYTRTGQLADLEEAIGVARDAVQHTLPDSPELPRNLDNLAHSPNCLYTRTGRLADLEEAILIWQKAVQRTHPASPELPSLLSDLGAGLRDRYDRTDQLADLEEAVRVWQTAVARTPPDSPQLPRNLNNLGIGLRDCYRHTNQLADLEEAIRAWQTAVERAPLDSPEMPIFLNNLGMGLRDHYECTGQLANLEEAMRAFDQACQLGQERQISETLRASRNWCGWALTRHAWDEAVRAGQYGLKALEQLYQTQLLQQEQQSWQREGQGLYSQAAYALAHSGDLRSAAATLEQGQARGLNDRLARDEVDLQQVEQQAPDLYREYQEAANRLRHLEAAERQGRLAPIGTAIPPPAWTDHRQQVQQARADLQAAIAAIRQLDGYEQFLLLPRLEEVATAVQPGNPLVYLVITAVGSLALLLHRSTNNADVAIEPLWSDAFTEDDLNAFLVKEENGQLQGGYLLGQFSGGSLLRAALAKGLPLLGEKLLTPLAQRLRALGLQRVTLIPGGRLNLLPLHAAQVTVGGQPTIFGDAVAVSYAPSARTLATSCRRLKTHANQLATLLAVGNPLPLPTGIPSLHFARHEAEEVALRFGDTEHLFCETAATHAAVAAAIPGKRYLHFSCHGLFDLEQPLNSGLILSDGVRLTLRQVLDELSLRDARLVVLSACQTAVTDFNNLPDEVIGLPAGFLQAGAAGILGSLWPVDDLSTALFIDHFYQLHLGNCHEGMPPIEALQATQRWLRQVTVAELSNLFADYRAAAPDAPTGRMAYALAQEKYIDFTLAENQDETPYADPYFWAAFSFYGT